MVAAKSVILKVKSIMSINSAHAEAEAIADEFGFFDDWEDRYQMLIDQGRKLAPIPEKYRHDDFDQGLPINRLFCR